MPTLSERVRAWFRAQTALSLAVGVVGLASLSLVVGGTTVLIWTGGLIPDERILQTLVGPAQATMLYAGLGLGVASALVGLVVYRRMPTKEAREAAVSGAALGIQGVLLALFLLWFRAGEDLPRFVRQFFRFEILGEFMPQFLTAMRNTVFLALFGELLGIVIGLVFAMMALSRRRVVRAPSRVYVNFFRGTPLLWQLSFFYFGMVLGLALPITVYQAAILIFGLNAGAYTAEVFRAGIQSIERGQIEAARSLGMTYFQAMRYAILPQAIRRVIPPLTNEFVILIKDTSLVVLLGLTAGQRELLTVARDAYAQTFNSTPWLAAAAGYLVITLPMIRAVTWLERKLRSGLAGVIG